MRITITVLIIGFGLSLCAKGINAHGEEPATETIALTKNIANFIYELNNVKEKNVVLLMLS